ncbi:MAG: hypothetical protein HDS60_03830 [Barnesiella sp.]|nr:hypothetical protein [Barnesiella sp.]
MNNIQNAQLLRDNCSALIAQLNNLGFTEINSRTPLSIITEYMQWAGGLRDIQLATINKKTGEYVYYSEQEWSSISASEKASVISIGLRIRAECRDFILSKGYVKQADGSTLITWGDSTMDVPGLKTYGPGSTGILNDFDSKGNTNLILECSKGYQIEFKAAEFTRAYKASTVADGGYDDITEWDVPTVAQMILCYKYKKRINDALSFFFGASAQLIVDGYHWTSNEASTTYAFAMSILHGIYLPQPKWGNYYVRAVADVPTSDSKT